MRNNLFLHVSFHDCLLAVPFRKSSIGRSSNLKKQCLVFTERNLSIVQFLRIFLLFFFFCCCFSCARRQFKCLNIIYTLFVLTYIFGVLLLLLSVMEAVGRTFFHFLTFLDARAKVRVKSQIYIYVNKKVQRSSNSFKKFLLSQL